MRMIIHIPRKYLHNGFSLTLNLVPRSFAFLIYLIAAISWLLRNNGLVAKRPLGSICLSFTQKKLIFTLFILSKYCFCCCDEIPFKEKCWQVNNSCHTFHLKSSIKWDCNAYIYTSDISVHIYYDSSDLSVNTCCFNIRID